MKFILTFSPSAMGTKKLFLRNKRARQWNKPPATERLYWILFGHLLNNYDVIRVERKTAEPLGINSFVQKRAQNREKTTSGDYFLLPCNKYVRVPLHIHESSLTPLDCPSNLSLLKPSSPCSVITLRKRPQFHLARLYS